MALAEEFYYEATVISEQAITGTSTTYAAYSVVRDSANHTITVKIGANHDSTHNFTGADGRWRKGVINISYTGNYLDSGSVHTITFSGFYVFDDQITGTVKITNKGHNAAGNLHSTVEVINGGIAIAAGYGGGNITGNSTHDFEYIANAAGVADDVYKVTGSGSGVSTNGVAFTVDISSPLKKEVSYMHIISGVLTLSPSGLSARTVDFGSGAHDDQATVVWDGKTHYITLK